jgi:glycoside/pentoside/hexuronide:cation symporter, GPH family
MVDRSRRLPRLTKLAFSAGSLEEAVVGAASMATILFYNQVLGLSAGLCGVVFLIASIVDGISDPIVGAYSDQFKSRWGRRHPFMFVSAVPLAVSFFCLYQPPGELSERGLFGWFLLFMILVRTAKTFYTVPHAALGAELTEDYHERTSVFAYNAVIGMISGVAFGVLLLVMVFPSTPEYSNGLLNESRYSLLAALGSIIIVVSLLLCTFGTRDQIPYLHQRPPRKIHLRGYLAELGHLLGNRSYLSVCASWLVLSTSIGVLSVVGTYTYIYAFEISTEQLTIQRFVSLPGIFIAIPLSVWLTKFFDKKWTVIYTCLVCAILLGLPPVLRMVDFFPDNDSPWLLVALFGPVFLAYLVAPLLPIVIDSQLADVADDHEYRTGHRSEGVVFSIRTFAMKASSGVGGLIGGFGLDLIAFPEDAVVSEVAPEALNGLLFMSGPLYWMIVAVSIGFMAMYQLTESRHAQILAELKERRALDEESRVAVS